MNKDEKNPAEKRVQDGNACIGLGVGVGALGAGAAAFAGAVCPVCFVAVPALVGVGLYERSQGKKQLGVDTPEGESDSAVSDTGSPEK